MKKVFINLFISLLLTGTAFSETVPVFKKQILNIQKEGSPHEYWDLWDDINDDGLTDLLILLQSKEKVFIYLQTDSGFPENPTQTITFPQDTLWFAICDISKHPRNEMLISTSEGLIYYRQNKSIFDITPHTLLEAKQIAPQNHPPILRTYDGKPENPIPIVFPDHTDVYECDENYQLKKKSEITHTFEHSIHKDKWSDWTLGSKPSEKLWIITKTMDKQNSESDEDKPITDNEHIEKLIKETEKKYDQWQYGIEKQDVNADGKEDFLLWYIDGEIDIKNNNRGLYPTGRWNIT